MSNPIFSISMTNYNNVQYIEEAIQSIIDQTYKDWYLHILDDGSTDDSLKAIYKMIKDHKQINLYLGQKNKGVAAGHKYIIEEIIPGPGDIMESIDKDDYVAIVDSDDVIVPTALEEMAEFIEQNQDCGFFYSNYSHCDQNLNRIRSGSNHQHAKTIIKDKDAVSHLKIFRWIDYDRSAKIDPYYIKAFDRDLVLRMEEVCKFAYYPKELYKWRGNKQGISRGKNGKIAYKYYLKACEDAKKRRNLI